MPKNEIFAKFAKELQADGMPLSVGVLYNNMHNQEFFDNLYGILQADGMQMDKQTFAKNLGLGTISSDYKTLGIDGKQNQVPIKTTPTTPKVTPITTQQPKPTAVVPNFNIPSVVDDAQTKTQLINSPSPQKAKIKEEDIVSPYYKGIKPDYSQQGTGDARLPTDKELSDFQSNEILKAPTLQTINKGIKNNTFIDPSIEEDYLKALSFSDDDLLADNETFNAKHDVVYGKTQSDEDYEIAQGKNDIGQKYKTEKQKIDNQYNLINTKINYLNKYIGEKYGSANILDDLDLDNKDLNTKLAKLESIKKSKQPILNDLQSQINLLNENQRLYPISENEYSAQFAFLKAKYDSEAKSINDEIKAIQETQKNFQDKYNDPAISSLLKLRQKAYDVSVQGMSLIDNPIFEKVKKREDEAENNQLLIDAKKKLELQLQNKEISFNEYSKYVENLDKAKNIGVNDQAFIIDKTMKLFKDIFTFPRTISGNVENNYGRVDRLADWATRVSERTTQKFPYSSNLQVNSFQKFAEVDGLRVLLDEKGNAYDVRDNNYFSINPIQAEKTIEKYKGSPQEYKKFNQTNVDVLAKNSLSTIADVGVMILGTKGLGAVAGGGRVASTLIGAGVIFTQTHADTYQQGLDAGLNPQQSAQYASLISGGISLISFINPVEYKLAGGGGLFNSIKSNAISNADVALINSGKLSIGEVAKKHTIGIIKNTAGENLEEMVFEPIMQDYVSNMYSKKADKGFEKQFDPISKQGLETFIITTATAIPFGIAEVNREMPNYQAEALVTAIENPSTYMQVLQKRKEMGIISEIQMEQQIVQMDEISAIYNSVADDIKENDKAILAGLLAKKNVVTNKIKEIGDNVLSKKWNDTLSKIDEDIQSIVDGVETKNNLVGKGATETNEQDVQQDVQQKTQQEKPIKVFSDFDNTLFDPTTQTLTPLGEEMKLRIEAGEDIEIVTARENTKENVDLIAEQLGIDASKITLGLTPEMKAEKVDEFEGKSQFIDDNTDNLQAVEGLGNDNVEVVPIVSKKETLFSKLSAEAKANKEAKKLEKETLAKSQEVPLNEKGEVDLPKIASDAIEVKTEVKEVSVGVVGDIEIKNEGKADAPTKESVTERLSINNPFYKKVEDALVKLGLIEKYNAETGTGDVVGGYAQQTSDGGFSVGKMLFSQDGSISYFDGDVKVSFDKNGNVISENTKEAKQKANVLAIESKKESIDNLEKTRDSESFKYKEVTETDVLGNKKKVKRLKTEQELKESTDKINAAIDKAKAELSNLEQPLKETTKAETTTTTSNVGVEEGTQSESNSALRDVESTAKALEEVSKTKPTLWEKIKDAIKSVGNKLGIVSNADHINNFNKAKAEWDKLSSREKKLKRADYELDDLYHTEGGYYKVGNSLIDLDLNPNHFKILLENNKFLNILNKLGVTKIHSENRPPEEMFAHYSDGKIHLNNNSAFETEEQLSFAMSHELGHHEWTKLTKEERDYVRSLPLETGMAKHYEAQEKSGKGKETSASLQEENFADYVMQYFQGKLYGDEALLNKIPTKLRELFDNKYSDLLKDNEHSDIAEAYHKAKADGTNPELVKAVEQSLKETPQAETQKTKAIITEIKSKNLTHVRGKGMGENQALGTFISTEENNRYETPTQKAEQVNVEIENPLVVDDDYGLVGKRQEILNENRDKFTAEDSNDYQDLPNKKLTLDDLNDDGIKKLAILTTEALKAQGYDSIYFRESDTQEGELVVFDKKKVTFKENNIKLAENEKQQSEPGEKSINPISKDSVQKDTKKDETKTITKRKGTPKSRRQIRNPEYLKALSHEVLDVVDYVKQVIIGGATVQPIVIQQLFTTDRRNSNAGRDKSLAEKRSRIGILDKNGYPTISAFAHALWSNQVDKFGYEKFDTQQFENAIEEVISNFVGTRKLVDELNEMYDISDEKRYELERGSQGYSEYSDLVDETQYEQEDIDNAINMFENLSDEEIKRIESGSDAFLDRLVNDYLVAEYGEILNKEQNKPEEKKPSKNSPELISINKKIEEAEAEITKSNERLKDKIKELDKAITEDNADLFGNRKSEKVNLFEGSERVDLKQREKILEPFKNSVLKAKESLNKLKKKKQDIVDGKVESTGEIIFEEETKGEGDDRVLFSLSDDNQDPYTEVVNGFYSPLEKIINETKFDKLPAKQWIDKFARGEEAKWTGLTDWLSQQQGSVSKADIQQYLKENRVQIVEVVKGERTEYIDDIENELAEIRNKIREEKDIEKKAKLIERRIELQEIFDDYVDNRRKTETKFSQYQLEGEKENYKEVLVTMPSKQTQEQRQKRIDSIDKRREDLQNEIETLYKQRKDETKEYKDLVNENEQLLQERQKILYNREDNTFRSSHFDEPNILVHLRMNTRVDAEGKKVLFLEELQSDWGQEGKKKGFDEKYKESEVAVLDENAPEANQPNLFWYFKVPGNVLQIPKSRYKTIEEAKNYVVNDKKKVDSGISQAPFVTDTNAWTKLGLKVALKEAVKQGADKIAWSTGTQQFDRWGSEEIHWDTVMKPKGFEIVVKDDAKRPLVRGSRIKSLSSNDGSKDQQAEVKRLAEKWNLKPEDLEVVPSKGRWTLAINEQTDAQAFQGNEEALRNNKLEESDISVGTKDELRDAIKRNLARERNDAEIDKLTDRIWNRMQTEDIGTSLPRKEGMEEFYGNPADMKRAENFTIKKEGELFAVKDEKGKTIRTFKQENEANKFKENYGLGIVGNVAKSLFKQEPKTVEVKLSDNLNAPFDITVKDERGNITTHNFDSKSKASAWLSKEVSNGAKYEVISEKSQEETTSTQHSIDITPEMRAEVQGKGQPLFVLSNAKDQKPFETNDNTKATKEDLTKTFPDAVVVQSESELPQAIQSEIKQQRAEGKVKGVFYNGKIYMVADNIKTIGEATGTYRHEKLGHKGVISYLKDKLDTYATRIIDNAKGEQLGKLKQLAKRYGFPIDLTKLTPKQKSDLGQEYIAMISENKSKYPKLWNDLVSFVREAIRMFGIKLSVTDTEIQSLIGKVEKIEKTNNDLTKNGKSQFQLSEDTSQKFDPKNESHVRYSDMLNEYVDISIEEGVIPTLELLKSEIDEETFDEIASELGIPFIEGKFNTPFIQNLKLENLSKEQKDNPLVERAQITLGEDARQELDEIGRTYTADKWKEIEPQVDAFVQRVLGSRNFNESVLEIIQWMKDMPMSTYLNEDGIATAHTMILNKLSMHAYTIDKELFKEVFKFSKIRATSFGQAIAAYAEASTPESLFNNAIADLEIEKEEILNTVQPNGKTLKQELDLILEQISIKADEITEVLNAIDATTQNVANKTKGKTNKPSGSKPSTSKTKSNFVPRSKEAKEKAKVRIDNAKARMKAFWDKQNTIGFAYDPKADLKAHEEFISINKEFVLGFLEYGYSSILNIKEKLQAVLGKNANVDDFWHEVYDEKVRLKVKDLEKEQIVNAIVNAIKEPGDAKEVNAISQISRILAGVARNKSKSNKATVPIEEKVRLLFENKDVASKAVEEALRIGIEQIKNNPKLSDAQKLERTTTLQDLASNFTVVPESVSRKAIQAGLKDIKETIESIAKKHYLDAEDAKQSLIDKLVLNAGLSHEDAKNYADILSNELDKQLGEKKAKLADKLLNPTPRKKGGKKGGNKGGNRTELTDKEKIVNAIVNAIKDNAATKKQSPINQLARIMGGLVKKLNNSEKTIKPIEEKIRLLFENNLLANEALKESLALGIEEITNNKKLTDEEKEDNIQQLKDIVEGFTIVPESITQKAIKLGLTKTGQTIESVANLTEEQINDIKKKLIDKLVKDANMSKYESQDYAELIEKEFDKLISDKKANLLDELLNPKPITKTVTKKEIEKIIRAINLGALSSNEFSNLFAEKFGFREITKEQVATLKNLTNLMFQQNGIMRRRIAQKLADEIDAMKPMDARTFWRLMQNIIHQHALNGINTFINIAIGSTASTLSNLIGSFILNPRAFIKANIAYNKAGLGATGRWAAIDTMWTGYNDMHNFTTDENFMEKGSRYHKYINKWGFKDWKDFMSVVYKPFAQLAYFASAFDNIINHRGGEVLNYIAEVNALGKEGKSIKEIYELVEQRMGYDKALEYSKQVDKEIVVLKDNNITIPHGFKEQRVKELMISHRDKERQSKAYETIRTFGLMGNPDGISGAFYNFLKPASIIQDKDSNLTAHLKGIYSTTIALFLRISFASAGAVINATPGVGFVAGLYKIEKNEKTKRREFRRTTGREFAHVGVMQGISGFSLIAGFMAMFDMEDDEEGNTVISLDPNRNIDITGTNIEFFDQDKLQLDRGKYKPLSIRFRKSDGTWGGFHEIGKYMPFAVPTMAILGNLRDKILIKKADQKEDDLKKIYPNAKEVLNSLMSIGGGLQVASYNSLAQFVSKASAIASYKNNSPEIQAEKKIQDSQKLAFNTITRPLKAIPLPSSHRDIAISIKALAGSQKKMGNTYENIFRNLYGLDHFINHKELDIFGNKVLEIFPIRDTDERYKLPEWELLNERNIVFDTPYFYKTGTFDGEKVKITNDERLILNDRVSIEFGNLIRENIDELKEMNQLDLLQEFKVYATMARSEITQMEYKEAIKPIDYEKLKK